MGSECFPRARSGVALELWPATIPGISGATPKNTRRRRYTPRNAPARPSSISEFGLKTWRAGTRPGNYPKWAAEAVELRKSKTDARRRLRFCSGERQLRLHSHGAAQIIGKIQNV